MKLEKRDQWLFRLRSGLYPQAKGQLARAISEDGETYKITGNCCLGVLCEVEEYERVPSFVFGEDEVRMDYIVRGSVPDKDEAMYSDLPGWYETAEGLDATVPLSAIPESIRNKHCIEDGRLSSILIYMNDDGFTFNEIADFIEQHLPVEA